MTTETNLATIFDAIMDSIVRELKDSTEIEVEEVLRGDRSRPVPTAPMLWVIGEAAQADNTYTTLQERWILPVAIGAVVSSYDAETGYQEASLLAAKARAVIVKNRRLKDADGKPLEAVQDVRGGRFEPSAPWHNKGNLYTSIVVLNVIFRTRE